MKKYFQLIITAVTFILATQAAFGRDKEDTYRERDIAAAMSSNGLSLSFTEKSLNRMGDGAAIALVRILGEKSLTQPTQVRDVLSIVRQAFTAPRIITREADRAPKATLFLLNWLRDLPASRELIPKIEETRTFVIQASTHRESQ